MMGQNICSHKLKYISLSFYPQIICHSDNNWLAHPCIPNFLITMIRLMMTCFSVESDNEALQYVWEVKPTVN